MKTNEMLILKSPLNQFYLQSQTSLKLFSDEKILFINILKIGRIHITIDAVDNNIIST